MIRVPPYATIITFFAAAFKHVAVTIIVRVIMVRCVMVIGHVAAAVMVVATR
jgi:hypothetical protein